MTGSIHNCPNCGAPIEGDRCLYCRTVFKQPEVEAEIKRLRAESETLMQAKASRELYMNALNAMNQYLSPNEIRVMCGLERREK